MLDLAILGGDVVDGTGRPIYKANVGIQGGRIVCIGQINKGEALHEISAAGDAVCPGFIDTHSHSDLIALAEPALLPKLMQGITTEVLGQDGIGAAPMDPGKVDAWRQYLSGLNGDPDILWDWKSVGQYAERLATAHTGTNTAILIPQGNIRMVTVGLENVPADEGDLSAMEGEVRRGMEEGAVGISLGLVYMPCTFSRRDELIRLFGITGKMGGFLAVHIRSGGDFLLESVQEVISWAREAEIPLHISHFKASGRRNWHKMRPALEAVSQAHQQGLDISFDIYPYTATSTTFLSLLPHWVLEGGVHQALQRLRDPSIRERIKNQFLDPSGKEPGGRGGDNPANLAGWNNIIISSVGGQKNQAWVGRSVHDIARDLGKDPPDAALDILIEEEGRVGMIAFQMDEANVTMGLRHPLSMICTDGLLGGKPHPRVYGTYPRVLGLYVRERKELSLIEAVHKMTLLPARRVGLHDRGALAEGMAADIVIFNPETVMDLATYESPREYPAGIRHVFVNGVHSIDDGKFIGRCGGQVLRKR